MSYVAIGRALCFAAFTAVALASSAEARDDSWITVVYKVGANGIEIERVVDGVHKHLNEGDTFEAYLLSSAIPPKKTVAEYIQSLRPDVLSAKLIAGYRRMLCDVKLEKLQVIIAARDTQVVPIQTRFGLGVIDAKALSGNPTVSIDQTYAEKTQSESGFAPGDDDGTVCPCQNEDQIPLKISPVEQAEGAYEYAIPEYEKSQGVADTIDWLQQTIKDRQAEEARANTERKAQGKAPIKLPSYGGIGCCSTYVSRALFYAGLTSRARLSYRAKDSGAALEAQGFHSIMGTKYSTPRSAPKGAVLVYDGEPDGHIEIKTEPSGKDGYVSDFEGHIPYRGRLKGIYIKAFAPPSAVGK